jgi:hypothetical protein
MERRCQGVVAKETGGCGLPRRQLARARPNVDWRISPFDFTPSHNLPFPLVVQIFWETWYATCSTLHIASGLVRICTIRV